MSLAAMGIAKLLTSVAVLGAAGFAGFNLMATGSPLGSCQTKQTAAVQLVAEQGAACSEDKASKSDCDESKAEQVASVQLVADKSEACAEKKAESCDDTKAEQLVTSEKPDDNG